ncbi:MAG: hypothetical protein JNK76_16065 [Planctomycetales bacterium]|nr:hypothetical protein [Planctomycetales bacterium]MBN8624799.1 hypothetical protein [Planctomycetota bacterium]
MIWNPFLWRTARRIETAYRRQQRDEPTPDLPWSAWQRLSDAVRLGSLADRRDWRHACEQRWRQADGEFDLLLSDLRALRHGLQLRRRTKLPQLVDLYAELVAAHEEFDGLAVDDSEIYVTTEPVTLEGVYLGPFEIRLNLVRLDEQEPYRIVAIEPHPAQTSSETTHPHVHYEKLCLGDGKAPVAAALAEGRLYDLFQLLRQILLTYGEGSAYVPLEAWHGTPCGECDATVDEDDLYLCRGCETSLCGDCVRVCDCGAAHCHDCATSCSSCEETTCSRCLTACELCESEFCANCLTGEGLCHACQEAAEEERLAEERAAEEAEDAADEQFIAAESESEVHAVRLGEALVSPRPRHHRNRPLRNLGRRRSAAP